MGSRHSTMNDSEINSQISQMVQFIHQVAAEKAAEIRLKANEEFNIEKLRMVEAEKAKTPLEAGIGGCEVRGFGGKIAMENTLQSRLMLAYETRLPQLRAALFN